jgi:pimeloyl-ACP methyl ester carboxylesterase
MRSFMSRCVQIVILGVLFVAAQHGYTQASQQLELLSPIRTPKGLQLGWTDVDGGSQSSAAYTVQFQETLNDVIWRIPEGLHPLPLFTNAWLDTETSSATRFYRVVRVPAAERGKVLAAELKMLVGLNEMRILFQLAQVPITPRYTVRLYKLTYETISPLGGRTTASGALCLPELPGVPLPLVSYQHGTILETNKAPSSMDPTTEVLVGIGFATDGYAAVVPDYLGLGDSPGLHPYHHARSEATACVDMLHAAKMACATNGFALSGKLFLCGYSQGGHATMAFLRELETGDSNELTVTACAPMAGAYDLSETTRLDSLSGRQQPNPYYFLYLLGAYQEVYKMAPSLPDMLAAPYDTVLPPLLSGNTSSDVINAAMPSNPTDILKPEYLAEFNSNPRHPLRLALQDNDVYRWTPKSPLRFYHCGGDQDVTKANSEVAVAYLHSVGREDVLLVDPVPTGSHTDCVQPSLLGAKAWFDSLR